VRFTSSAAALAAEPLVVFDALGVGVAVLVGVDVLVGESLGDGDGEGVGDLATTALVFVALGLTFKVALGLALRLAFEAAVGLARWLAFGLAFRLFLGPAPGASVCLPLPPVPLCPKVVPPVTLVDGVVVGAGLPEGAGAWNAAHDVLLAGAAELAAAPLAETTKAAPEAAVASIVPAISVTVVGPACPKRNETPYLVDLPGLVQRTPTIPGYLLATHWYEGLQMANRMGRVAPDEGSETHRTDGELANTESSL
jgi:hypothetical protein